MCVSPLPRGTLRSAHTRAVFCSRQGDFSINAKLNDAQGVVACVQLDITLKTVKEEGIMLLEPVDLVVPVEA